MKDCHVAPDRGATTAEKLGVASGEGVPIPADREFCGTTTAALCPEKKSFWKFVLEICAFFSQLAASEFQHCNVVDPGFSEVGVLLQSLAVPVVKSRLRVGLY